MIKQGPNGIEWTDYTWNPVTGCYGPYGTPESPNRCSYCYASQMSKRLAGRYGYPKDNPFAPTFHEDRIEEPFTVGKPSMIFVSSMGDLFGEWVPKEWIERVIEVTRHCDRHIYQFLTKNPKRYAEFDFPQNCWLGVTITKYDSAAYHKIIVDLGRVPYKNMNQRFISYEPIMGSLKPPSQIEDMFFSGVYWIILGAMTGPLKKQYEPDPKWIEEVVEIFRIRCRTVFMKNSLKPKEDPEIYWQGPLIQEWPR